MRALVYYVASTVDGLIADPTGGFEFFGLPADVMSFIAEHYPETLPTAARTALGLTAPPERFDAVVMGRGTYEPALREGITSPYGHLRQYVFSRTLAPSSDPEVEIVAADPVEFVRELKTSPGRDIWLCGGADLAGQLLPEVDELVVKLNPILAGSGIPLLRRDFDPRPLELVEHRALDSGVLVLRYRVAKP